VVPKPGVLHLIESFREGGSERQAAQLVRLLDEGGRFRLHVACLNAEGPNRAAVEALGLGPIEHYPLTSFYDANAARQAARLAADLRRLRVDVVHTHDFYTNVFGMAAAAVARVPVRVASRRETAGTRSRAQKLVERAAFRLATAVVANAEAVRAVLVAEGVPEARTVTVYNGLDLDRVRCTAPRAEALDRLGLPDDPRARFVTIVANLRLEVKDHPTFLRAAARVAARHPEATFLVAGEGPLVEPTRELARQLGIGASVRFLGACDAVGELLSVSDVCVLSSRAEGFSNAILEYMAAGRPVVATDVGGAREAVVHEETGYLVPAGDDAAMARRIDDILSFPTLSRVFGANARARVERHFSCAAQRASVERLYDRLLAERSRTRQEAALAPAVRASKGDAR
jgi:glycosyltransferase involved in cell wall biosynthesis